MGCCTSLPRDHLLIQIPSASLHLITNLDSIELANGDLTILTITKDSTLLATAVKIGPRVQWPLTRDEPVVKIDQLNYLFTLPDGNGGFLNYRVSFAQYDPRLGSLDSFLKENACFSIALNGSSSSNGGYGIEEYNGAVAKAMQGGTGEIVQGVFRCSDGYSNQVQNGAAMIRPQAVMGRTVGNGSDRGTIKKSLRRVRKLSEMTEKMSKSLLNGVVAVTGTAAIPLVRSKAGKALLGSFPGQVILGSLDAVNMVLDAVEAAERKALAATSGVVSGAVSKRFGESAGEATEDVFATAGHACGTAWNIFKLRKAIKPSSVPSSLLKNAVKNRR